MDFDQRDDEIKDLGIDDRDAVSANRHPSRYRQPRLLPRRRSARSCTSEEMLEDNGRRVRELYTTGRITVVDGRENFKAGALEDYHRLLQERRVIQAQIGPFRLPSGLVFDIQHNDTYYSFAPYQAWLGDFAQAFNSAPPTLHGPFTTRDRIAWLYWHFRHRAILRVGKVFTKTRGPLVQCVGCGSIHRYLSRPRDANGVSRCRNCGHLGHRNAVAEPHYIVLPRITKTYLRGRFKIPSRHLERILAVDPPTEPRS